MIMKVVALIVFGVLCYVFAGQDGETGTAMLVLPIAALLSMLVLSHEA